MALARTLLLPALAAATSFKMDFLSSGTVRTDPLAFSQTGECLSDHVHRFYGAVSDRTMRPEVSFEDLRAAPGNTGNVEENKSLYWNPAIYKVKRPSSGSPTFQIVDVWFASAYYIFRTGQATAFPRGLKMKTMYGERLARVTAICDGDYPCERNDAGGCQGYGPSNQTQHGFLPVTGCTELELNLKFPTCWDGVNTESATGDHVMYAPECDGESNECFDLACPASHPVTMPEIHLYVRVQDYEGGAHMFADGSDVFHSDYMSGWDEDELQRVLDNCENDSEAAMPTAYCSDWLTFRGKGKTEGVQVEDTEIRSGLEELQPAQVDIQATICAEAVTGVAAPPRGTCTGTLIPYTSSPNVTTSTSAPPAVSGVVTCAKKTKKTVKVRNGESYTFKTNADGSQYGANTKCSVSYKKTRGCKNLKISCDQFSLGAGDFLRVGKGKKNTFKGNTGPQNLRVSSKAMKVFFKSNRGNHGDGASCTISC